MLFHVTMTHTAEECPGYNPDKMKELLEAADKMEDLGKQWKVKPLFVVNGMPEHVAFTLLEADSPLAVAQFLHGIPFKQDYKVTPVMHQQEVIQMMKAAMPQG